MPIKPENQKRYPGNWRAIRDRVIFEAGDKCEICGARNHQPHPITGSKVVLTVAHWWDPSPENCARENLKAACQRCHLEHDRQQRALAAERERFKKLWAEIAEGRR